MEQSSAQVQAWLEDLLRFGPTIQQRVLLSLLVVVVIVLLRSVVVWYVLRKTEDARIRYRTGKIASYVAAVLTFLLLGRIWFSGFRDLSTFLGLLSAGLAIALKDLVTSIAGWTYILWRKPFEVGDRIQIGSHAGDVVDQRLFRFTLLEIGNWVHADQSTGRIIHIPNSRVFTDPIANYTHGFPYIWNEVEVLVTFESNWKKAKEILQKIVDRRCTDIVDTARESLSRASRSVLILYSTLTPRVWTSVADSGVLLTIRYLCDPRRRRGSAEMIWEDILEAFSTCDDIDFAYPTIRRFINVEEGKPGTGGPPREAKVEAKQEVND